MCIQQYVLYHLAHKVGIRLKIDYIWNIRKSCSVFVYIIIIFIFTFNNITITCFPLIFIITCMGIFYSIIEFIFRICIIIFVFIIIVSITVVCIISDWLCYNSMSSISTTAVTIICCISSTIVTMIPWAAISMCGYFMFGYDTISRFMWSICGCNGCNS